MWSSRILWKVDSKDHAVAASSSDVHAGDDLSDRATPLSGTQLIAHPGERDGEVIRLWPRPPKTLDLRALEDDSPVSTHWLERGQIRFAPGMFDAAEIAPLGSDLDLMRWPHAVEEVRI